jgi:hypothetical protein
MNEITFYPSQKKTFTAFFIALLFSFLTVYMAYSETFLSKSWCIATSMLAFFGVVALFLLYSMMFKKTPYLILNENGILAHACPFIEWNNVKNIYFKKIKAETYLCIQPYNSDKLIDEEKLSCAKSEAKKLNLATYQKMFGTAVAISVDHLPIKQAELLDLINKFKSHWAAEYLKN